MCLVQTVNRKTVQTGEKMEQFMRTELLLGEEGMKKLAKARVAVFGIGGVGGHAVEALARCGVGQLDLIDSDVVNITNVNRQMVATLDTVGRYKTDVAAERIKSINPECVVRTYRTFFLPENSDSFEFEKYDYVVDAIDTVAGKVELIVKAKNAGVPVISSMGAGNKLNPAAFEVADIYKTSVCPLAKVMRHECKKRGIESLKVVFSKEEPRPVNGIISSVAFVPSVVGLIMAGEVVKDIVVKNGIEWADCE